MPVSKYKQCAYGRDKARAAIAHKKKQRSLRCAACIGRANKLKTSLFGGANLAEAVAECLDAAAHQCRKGAIRWKYPA